jgi:hypothetical protein
MEGMSHGAILAENHVRSTAAFLYGVPVDRIPHQVKTGLYFWVRLRRACIDAPCRAVCHALRHDWAQKAVATLLLSGLFYEFAFGSAALGGPFVLLESEAFPEYGGWVLDQQFMDQMGSPFLLAHGLGDPVRDAVIEASFPEPGRYRVWVRTRDWVAAWRAPGAPGRFQVLIDGRPLETLFGTEGSEWHWQDGGTVELGVTATVGLHDLTGFDGRCDAIVFSKDLQFRPPNQPDELARFRRSCRGLPEHPGDAGSFDLVVTGGGIAGTCAAVAAARLGLTVALIQDRPVLGGNGSSEVRVWPEGHIQQKPYPHVGDLVAELVSDRTARSGNAKTEEVYDDGRKLAGVRNEPRITLFLEQRVNGVDVRQGVLRSVVAENVRTGGRVRISGKWFADCTGDGEVGYLAGADHEVTAEKHMGASNLWHVEDTGRAEPFPRCLCQDTNALNTALTPTTNAAPFPRCPWAVDLSAKPFPGRPDASGKAPAEPLKGLGEWFWESGFDRDPIRDVEWMRDLNLRAMYGAWDTLKNVDKLYPNHKLSWAAFIAGKRESRRLLGDIVLSASDFRESRPFPDGCFPCSWGIDLHSPDPAFQKGHEGAEFIAQFTHGAGYTYAGPYWAPYRCLYSRNVANLFMAGRDISVTHEALGPVRVMRTCGMMGEVVGMAAAVCQLHGCTPRAVYEQHLEELKTLLNRGVGRSPAVAPK